MTPTWFFLLSTATVIGCGLIAGIFLAFSDFIMRALKLSQHIAGITVMQIINIEVWRSVFMVLLWAFLMITAGLASYAHLNITGPVTTYILTGTALYMIGVFGVSFMLNIPMNDRLSVLDATSPQAREYWTQTYLPRWTFCNYLRAITAAGTAVSYLIAIILLAQT